MRTDLSLWTRGYSIYDRTIRDDSQKAQLSEDAGEKSKPTPNYWDLFHKKIIFIGLAQFSQYKSLFNVKPVDSGKPWPEMAESMWEAEL